jgi:peptidoglycan hydrolase-like protein with peptidoglycan-binding domain
MFLTTKIERAASVLAVLTTTLLGQGFPQSAAKSGSEPAVEAFVIKNEVTKMQETLRDKGYFSGKIDGIFGLRTRESIRAYQRAEKFPVTGQVDQRTAAGLGVRPEVSWDDSDPGVIQASDKTESETAEGKPSANIKWTNGSRRDSKKLRKPVKPVATTKGPGEHGASPPQAASGSHTQ